MVTYGEFAKMPNGSIVYVSKIINDTMAIVHFTDYPYWHTKVPLCKLGKI